MQNPIKLKNIFILTLLFFVIANSNSYPQYGKIKNKKAFLENLAKQRALKQKKFKVGGNSISAQGTVKALLIFIQFDDDSLTSSKFWPYDTLNLPAWTKSFVNSKPAKEFKVNNLTQYFYEMSNGKLNLIGDIYPKLVRPEHDSKYYKNISEVNTEILERLDKEIDYSKYDNWSRDKKRKFIMKPDGKVDMIFMLYRNFPNRLFFNNGWSGIAHLYLSKREIKTDDGVVIKSGSLDKGSGLIARGGKNGFEWFKYVVAHEFGHFLLGTGHISGVTNLALMTGGPVWNASRGMHSWERARLGWINFVDVTPGIDAEYSLPDYMTTNSALRLKLSDKEWFVIENRQKISPHDKAGDRGIYIYRILNPYYFAPKIFVECADGNWDFGIDTLNKKLFKIRPNPLGKNEMNFSKYVKGKNYACFKPVYKTNAAWGDNTDAFDTVYNNVFSPVSNPPSSNNAKIKFTVEVTEQTGNIIKVKFYFSNPYAGKPAKPQNFTLKRILKGNRILLTWDRNREPDLLKYKLYSATGTEFDYKNLKPVKTLPALLNGEPLTEFILNYLKPRTAGYKIFYSISAVDTDGNESALSNYVEVN